MCCPTGRSDGRSASTSSGCFCGRELKVCATIDDLLFRLVYGVLRSNQSYPGKAKRKEGKGAHGVNFEGEEGGKGRMEGRKREREEGWKLKETESLDRAVKTSTLRPRSAPLLWSLTRAPKITSGRGAKPVVVPPLAIRISICMSIATVQLRAPVFVTVRFRGHHSSPFTEFLKKKKT